MGGGGHLKTAPERTAALEVRRNLPSRATSGDFSAGAARNPQGPPVAGTHGSFVSRGNTVWQVAGSPFSIASRSNDVLLSCKPSAELAARSPQNKAARLRPPRQTRKCALPHRRPDARRWTTPRMPDAESQHATQPLGVKSRPRSTVNARPWLADPMALFPTFERASSFRKARSARYRNNRYYSYAIKTPIGVVRRDERHRAGKGRSMASAPRGEGGAGVRGGRRGGP